MAKSKCTEELIAQAVKLRKNGMSYHDMTAALGIAQSTFYKWMNQPERPAEAEFSESIRKAEAEYKASLRSKVLAKTDRDWKAAAWMLERQYPDEYGRRERHEVVAEVDARHMVEPSGASPEAVEKAEELLELLYGDRR